MRSRRAQNTTLRPLVHAAAVALAAAAALAACERRIEEPALPARSVDPLSDPPHSASAPGSPASPPAPIAAARCITPTPTTPARILARAGADPACPADPTGPFDLRHGKVVFLEANAPDLVVEVAQKDEERQRGLMFRKSMAENHGMIFVFEDRRNHTFWMHNTCIPLDMLFIDSDGTIVGIEENTPTLNDSTFQVGCPSTYVLEVNAGWARRHGVVAGQKVKLDGV